jgi:hypothetical protein
MSFKAPRSMGIDNSSKRSDTLAVLGPLTYDDRGWRSNHPRLCSDLPGARTPGDPGIRLPGYGAREEPTRIVTPGDVWSHVSLVFVSVTPLGGVLTTELGYSTAWDDEHTLGARFQSGRFIELCGSVSRP